MKRNKYYYIDDEKNIDEKALKDLIDFFNQLDAGDQVVIYINSEGGNYSDGMAILDLLKREGPRVTLKVNGEISSVAFWLFMEARECKREVGVGAYGMFHLPRLSVELNTKLNPTSKEGSFNKSELESLHLITAEFMDRIGMSSKEKAYIENGGDFYFNSDDLKRFVKNSE